MSCNNGPSSGKFMCPTGGEFCKTCPPYNMNSVSSKAWDNRFDKADYTKQFGDMKGGAIAFNASDVTGGSDMMAGYSYCGKQSVHVGGANGNNKKNLSNNHSKMNSPKPSVPMRRNGSKPPRRVFDNSAQLKAIEDFKSGKLTEAKALGALDDLNLPEKKLPTKENVAILKKIMADVKAGKCEVNDRLAGTIRRVMRAQRPWELREGDCAGPVGSAKPNNKKNNAPKANNNNNQAGGAKKSKRSSRKASKKSKKSSKKSKRSSRKASKKHGGAKKSKRSSRKASKKSKRSHKKHGGAKKSKRSSRKASKKSKKSSKKSKRSSHKVSKKHGGAKKSKRSSRKASKKSKKSKKSSKKHN